MGKNNILDVNIRVDEIDFLINKVKKLTKRISLFFNEEEESGIHNVLPIENNNDLLEILEIVRYHWITKLFKSRNLDPIQETAIQQVINSYFPGLPVRIWYDYSDEKYFVSIPDEKVYHSDGYQKIVMEIKIHYLWVWGVSNCFFICENRK